MSQELSWGLPVLGRGDVACPSSLGDLLDLVHRGRRPYAGGTDLLVKAIQDGSDLPPMAWTPSVAELRVLDTDASVVRLGAAVTHAQVARSPELAAMTPALVEAADIIGSIQIRNAATLVGNVCNASPAADTVPALVVHRATATIRSHGGRRTSSPVLSLALGPARTILGPTELVTALDVEPLGRGEGSAYQRFTVRKSMDLAFVGVAVWLRLHDDRERIARARIALGAVAPTVVLAGRAAEVLQGSVPTAEVLEATGQVAAEESFPISDLRASAAYRKHLVRIVVGDVVLAAYRRAQQSG